jgi:hypothetical protein
MAEKMTANGLVVGLIVEPEVKKAEKNAAPVPNKAKAPAKASKE